MSTRKSHSKSRNGCKPCKKRRVKCDEQGPPCANCAIRQSQCVYEKKIRLDSASSSTTPDGLLAPGGPALSPSPSPSPSSSARSDTGSLGRPDRRVLELQLMHRWSTRTYRTVCSLDEEEPLMLLRVPRDALRYDYLMDIVLAVTALDLADEVAATTATLTTRVSSPPGGSSAASSALDYARMAADYFDRGRRSFRAELGSVTAENHLPLYLFGALMVPAIFALARFGLCPDEAEASAVGAAGQHLRAISVAYDALAELHAVCAAAWAWLERGPVRVRAWLEQPVPRHLLDDDTRAAVARLHTLNEWLHGCAPGGEPGSLMPGSTGTTSPEEASDMAASHAAYLAAALHLEDCFARDLDTSLRGSCAGWIALSYPRFQAALRNAEPLALLVAALWGVLADGMARRGAWFARGVGPALVESVSAELRTSPLMAVPGTWEALSWARERVGLGVLSLE